MEKEIVDRLVDYGPVLCGQLDKSIIVRLISRGLVYLDVPIKNDDYIYGKGILLLLKFFQI